MTFCNWLVPSLAIALMAACANAAQATSPQDTKPSNASSGDQLLTAINFALTATGTIRFRWLDRKNCVVTSPGSQAMPSIGGAFPTETYFLGNLDASRILVGTSQLHYPDGSIEDRATVDLHGEDTIRTIEYAPAVLEAADRMHVPGYGDSHETDTTLQLQTKEVERLKRAWRFIYAHGCKSATSSF